MVRSSFDRRANGGTLQTGAARSTLAATQGGVPRRGAGTEACVKRSACAILLAGAAILGGVSLGSLSASAQSAEETVAFMLWGLEEGARTRRLAENQWETEGNDGDQSSFGIERLGDCLFRVLSRVRRPGRHDVLEFDYLLNFAAVHRYSAWLANGHDQRIIVKVEGRGWYGKSVRSRATGRVVYDISAGNLDTYVVSGGSVQRLLNAFAHFRSAYCGSGTDDPVRWD